MTQPVGTPVTSGAVSRTWMTFDCLPLSPDPNPIRLRLAKTVAKLATRVSRALATRDGAHTAAASARSPAVHPAVDSAIAERVTRCGAMGLLGADRCDACNRGVSPLPWRSSVIPPGVRGLPVDETDPVADWIRRWGAGDTRAAEQLFDRYARRLTHVAEQHLSRKLAAREGGEDVVQSVFRTFFRRSARGQFRLDG